MSQTSFIYDTSNIDIPNQSLYRQNKLYSIDFLTHTGVSTPKPFDIKSVTIGTDISNILPYTFYGFDISNIEIGTNLGHIGKKAFGYCNNLKTVTFFIDNSSNPNSVQVTDASMTEYQERLKNMFENDSNLFMECKSDMEIFLATTSDLSINDLIKDNIQDASYVAYNLLSEFTNTDGSNISVKTPTTIDLLNSIVSGLTAWDVSSVTLSKIIKVISSDAYAEHDTLKHINLLSSVIPKIPFCAFQNTGLTSINLDGYPKYSGGGVNIIQSYGFAGSELTDISLIYDVSSIGYAAFADCSLTSITIPKKVKRIDSLAFASNPNLSTITFVDVRGVESTLIDSSASKIFWDCSQNLTVHFQTASTLASLENLKNHIISNVDTSNTNIIF